MQTRKERQALSVTDRHALLAMTRKERYCIVDYRSPRFTRDDPFNLFANAKHNLY